MSRDPVAQGFHALAEPTRIQILELLKTKDCCVQDMVTALGVNQSHISFHLKILKSAGLVTSQKKGRYVYYQLNAEQIGLLETYLSSY